MAGKKIIVVGGGAAGFFTAISIAENTADYKIEILEKSSKLLSKVRISGGGRCNVTNERHLPSELVKFYPRGQKKLYKGFGEFGTRDMREWLHSRGVVTKSEADKRVFPITDSSETIIETFLSLCQKYGISIRKRYAVQKIEKTGDLWMINDERKADYIVWATGSSESSWKLLDSLGLDRAPALPSLFTFNIKDARINSLQGLSFEEVSIKVTGTKLEENGPLLITHWGLSGPAVLKLSSWGAKELHKVDYRFEILINFFPGLSQEEVRKKLLEILQSNPKKKLKNYRWQQIPNRYWEKLLAEIGLMEKLAGEIGKKQVNKLVEELTQARFQVDGKSTFKEEFVTCGGIELNEINLNTMESKKYPGLFLAGEATNIDALTGGFNFQACWTAGWLISQYLSTKQQEI